MSVVLTSVCFSATSVTPSFYDQEILRMSPPVKAGPLRGLNFTAWDLVEHEMTGATPHPFHNIALSGKMAFVQMVLRKIQRAFA